MVLAFLRVGTRAQVFPHQEIPARVCVNRVVVCCPTHRPAAARPDWWILHAITHFHFVRRIRRDLSRFFGAVSKKLNAVGPCPFDAGHSPSFSLCFVHEKSLQGCTCIPEGQRPTVALAGHIAVPPLPVKAGWRGRQALSGCKAILSDAANGSIAALAHSSITRAQFALGVRERHRAQSLFSAG